MVNCAKLFYLLCVVVSLLQEYTNLPKFQIHIYRFYRESRIFILNRRDSPLDHICTSMRYQREVMIQTFNIERVSVKLYAIWTEIYVNEFDEKFVLYLHFRCCGKIGWPFFVNMPTLLFWSRGILNKVNIWIYVTGLLPLYSSNKLEQLFCFNVTVWKYVW